MPPQHVEIAETILALKRALRREKEAPTDQPISSGTNRGNKLKKGANYVHAGSIPYRYGAHGYKERTEHAGYQRYILEKNPRRYNELGDELDDSESDDEADADAEDENPYSDIRIEELLRPLTHPAELATHPTLSLPYLDNALPEMVASTEAQLWKERANLWRAKNLHRQFIGDESWMPCERVEISDDWNLFEPLPSLERSSSGKKRKRDSDRQMPANGIQGQDHAIFGSPQPEQTNGVQLTNGVVKSKEEGNEPEIPFELQPEKMQNGDSSETKGNSEKAAEDVDMGEADNIKLNGTQTNHEDPGTIPNDTTEQAQNGNHQEETDPTTNDQPNHDNQSPNSDSETPPPPPRRITRALAAADTSNAPTPPFSPTTSTISTLSSSLLAPNGLFLLPPTLSLSHTPHPTTHLPLHVAHSGLPMDEVLETRRLLGMYIQKQEETIRGLEGVLGKLIKAKRMRERLWEWAKAEGHVGEWSDGEDWVDAEAWGIRAEELRKGRDEEEVEVQEEGRKGKRRRGRE